MPPILRFDPFAEAQCIIEPKHQASKWGIGQANTPSIPPFGVIFIVGTDPDTDRTIGIHIDPKFEAFFGIDGPFPNTRKAGEVRRCIGGVSRIDGAWWTGLSAFSANLTELFHPERLRGIYL